MARTGPGWLGPISNKSPCLLEQIIMMVPGPGQSVNLWGRNLSQYWRIICRGEVGPGGGQGQLVSITTTKRSNTTPGWSSQIPHKTERSTVRAGSLTSAGRGNLHLTLPTSQSQVSECPQFDPFWREITLATLHTRTMTDINLNKISHLHLTSRSPHVTVTGRQYTPCQKSNVVVERSYDQDVC